MTPHRRGKIARLPKHLRDIVNRMVSDGAEYKTIIAELEKHRDQWSPGITGFNKVNLNQWRHGGYEEWRAEHELQEERRAQRQETFQFLHESGRDGIDRAVPAMAKMQLFDVMFRADSRALSDKINSDPSHFVRTLNALLKIRKS